MLVSASHLSVGHPFPFFIKLVQKTCLESFTEWLCDQVKKHLLKGFIKQCPKTSYSYDCDCNGQYIDLWLSLALWFLLLWIISVNPYESLSSWVPSPTHCPLAVWWSIFCYPWHPSNSYGEESSSGSTRDLLKKGQWKDSVRILLTECSHLKSLLVESYPTFI